MHLYLTRHHGPQEDGEETREWQTEAVCWDGIHVEKERPCITERPEERPLISGTQGTADRRHGLYGIGIPAWTVCRLSCCMSVRMERGALKVLSCRSTNRESGPLSARIFELDGNMWPQVHGCATEMRPAGIR